MPLDVKIKEKIIELITFLIYISEPRGDRGQLALEVRLNLTKSKNVCFYFGQTFLSST